MSTNGLDGLSDWDLVNSFVTSVWNLRMNLIDKKYRPEFNHYMNIMNELRDELLKRLSDKS